MVFLSGPRQVGKTTLAKTFLKKEEDQYYNWDRREDRKRILSAQWPATPATIVLDELHKYRRWKSWIKGEYDTQGSRIRFLITGSARLDVYRRGGDSLQGRYHAHRLHGFSMGELLNSSQPLVPEKEIEFPSQSDPNLILSLLHFGPFPEPFIKQNERSLRRWRRERLDRFFREDVRELENIRDLSSMELLSDLLESRVASPLSLQSLREDLEVSHRAVSHWLEILERFYYCFKVPPFTHKAVRSLKKISKVYLWDWSAVPDEGSRFENLVAGHLLKLKHVLEDQEGYRIGLHYLRDADKREVDFLISSDNKPWFALECKKSGRTVNPALTYFGDRLKIPFLYQLNLEGTEDFFNGRVRVMPAAKFLSTLP
ncbi:MAG: ATP-binding protein [Deltaproteobacteria bacterium]|nr:ATP-binding protein [Deltaproteobacteria bacterium]